MGYRAFAQVGRNFTHTVGKSSPQVRHNLASSWHTTAHHSPNRTQPLQGRMAARLDEPARAQLRGLRFRCAGGGVF